MAWSRLLLLSGLACKPPEAGPTRPPAEIAGETAEPPGETGRSTANTSPTGDSGTPSRPMLTLADADVIYRKTETEADEDGGLGWTGSAVDIDHDGDLELVLGSGLHGYVFELDERRGELTSEDASMMLDEGGGWGGTVGDMDGDGMPDVLSFGFAYEEIFFTPQPMGGKATLWVDGYELSAPKPMDVDGDGQLDVVHGGNGTIQVFYGPFAPGEERWPDVQLRYEGPEVFALHAVHPSVDLTGDGQPDLLALGHFRRHVVPLPIHRDAVGATQGVFRLVEESSDPLNIGLASVDATGQPGLILGGKDPQDPDDRDRSGHHVAQLPVQDWNWTSRALFHTGRMETSFLRAPWACDVDSDGITDLVGVYWEDDGTYSAYVLKGPFEGDVYIEEEADLWVELDGMPLPADSAMPMDLNQNGELDLLVLERGNNYLFLDVGIGPIGNCSYPGSSMRQ